MKATFEGHDSSRTVSVQTEGSSIRLIAIQGNTVAGLAMDPDTALAFAAAVIQAARKVAR